MKYPKFILNEFTGGYFEYITPCPFGIIGKTGDILMVGSLACQRCQYFRGINREDSIVSCAIQ